MVTIQLVKYRCKVPIGNHGKVPIGKVNTYLKIGRHIVTLSSLFPVNTASSTA